MYRPRIIPVLLLKDGALVKSVRFKHHRYIGDPINAVRVFNDLKADELAFVDISATRQHRTISPGLIRTVGEEANMPFAVGGGIRTLGDIRNMIGMGAEKVIINTMAAESPEFIRAAVNEFGSSTITVCIDAKKNFRGKYQVITRAGKTSAGYSPDEFARIMEGAGAGELIIQSIDRDGTRLGYDIELVNQISQQVSVPVTALGGAGCYSHLQALAEATVVNGLAAGSLFVFHGNRQAVLISYPTREEITRIVMNHDRKR